jgi:hypothetical protein
MRLNLLRKLGVTTILLAAAFGCTATTPDQAAENARVEAADARADVVDAQARVTAADALVKAAEADARIDALTVRPGETRSNARVIPLGTLLKVSLIDPIDSDTSVAGDHFLASLAEAIVIDGATLLPKGTRVRGRVLNAEGAGKVRGRAAIHLELSDILLPSNRMIPIKTRAFKETADSTQNRDAQVIAGGVGMGAAIGSIVGGKKGAAIGAISGGGVGTGVVLATKGDEVHYEPETRLDFTLVNSIGL